MRNPNKNTLFISITIIILITCLYFYSSLPYLKQVHAPVLLAPAADVVGGGGGAVGELQLQKGLPNFQPIRKSIESFNENETNQNDSDLVFLIQSDYLLPPPSPTVNLTLKNPMWTSPVTQIVKTLLKNKTGGFFIECGAFDGEFLSNSIELETNFQWEGLLVEADPTYQEQLYEKNRKAWIAPVCLSPNPYPMKLTMQRHKSWDAMSNIPDLFFGTVRPGDFPTKFDVQCIPLYSLLLALNRTEIDYLSLDVEGAEWSIIQTIPFDKINIKVISMERTRDYDKSSKRLLSLGYKFHSNVNAPFVLDALYVHKSVL